MLKVICILRYLWIILNIKNLGMYIKVFSNLRGYVIILRNGVRKIIFIIMVINGWFKYMIII